MGIIKIFDTTLRDGEQSPRASMNVEEKLKIAKQLATLGVDVVEAGFAKSSPGDFEAIKRIGGEVAGPIICSLARAKEEDVKEAYGALENVFKKRIHVFHSTSDIHLKHQRKISREEALKRSVVAVELARSLVKDVEFSPMDATRTDIEFLLEVVEAVIAAGASTINIPDTVGYITPIEFGKIIRRVVEIAGERAVISVHCHNDLGLAVANSLAAVLSGAGQIECTINGIGERAGNASLEEVVMALKTRRDFFQADTGVITEEIYKTSRLVSKITGIVVQPNKAIVGSNAFAHESGIHQDGMLKERETYEIIDPKRVGIPKSKLYLGKLSGRHAVGDKLKVLGYELGEEEFNRVFAEFKQVADKKKHVFDDEFEALVIGTLPKTIEYFKLLDISISGGMQHKPMAAVRLSVGEEVFDKIEYGDGPVDAAFKAIVSITKTKSRLEKFEVKSLTGGTDAMGEVMIILEEEGTVRGNGADTNIVVAAAKAYVNALNKLHRLNKNGSKIMAG
ncbi:2-isopropylmalate synthase [Candidatus Falkowbacteria bacterium]|nr:2-isopropylmalate synthase [Candidatus Falkowbacteria bacterium]